MPGFEVQKLKQYDFLHESQLSYQEVILYLDARWKDPVPGTIQTINSKLSFLSSKLSSIIIAGTSGKSTTIYYLTKLLETEGLKVGASTSPHFNTYNERIAINGQIISNDVFTKLANAILSIVKTNQIEATSKDILIAMALLHFKNEGVDIAIFEQENIYNYDPVTVCSPKILGITRIVLAHKESIKKAIQNISTSISHTTFVTTADQSKSVIHDIAQKTKESNGKWVMPIRKTAALPYPYEQLHGRCAALAERIAETYVNQVVSAPESTLQTSLLRIVKKQRGRPSLTSKRYPSYSNKTMELFWQTVQIGLSHHFQKIELKHYTLLLDAAANIDALQNLLLGIRLLNYEKPFKSISFLLSCHDGAICEQEFIKSVRYFFKKTSSQLIICPVANSIGEQTGTPANMEKFTIAAQHGRIKVVSYKSFKAAFDFTTKQLYDPQDLLVITGSQAIISEYWKYKKNKDN